MITHPLSAKREKVLRLYNGDAVDEMGETVAQMPKNDSQNTK